MKVTVWGINYAPELTGIAPYNTALCEHLRARGLPRRLLRCRGRSGGCRRDRGRRRRPRGRLGLGRRRLLGRARLGGVQALDRVGEREVGGVIEKHLVEIGFLAPADVPAIDEAAKQRLQIAAGDRDGGQQPMVAGSQDMPPKLGQCPNCGAAAVVHQEGCDTCLNCGYSRCG